MSESTSTSTSVVSGKAKYESKHIIKELNDHAREFFLHLADDPELYKSYLSTIAKFPSYSAMNAVRIHEAAPDATQIRDLETWNKFGCTVKGKESGIPITQPEYNSKTHKTFFKVKYLFAEDQVTGAAKAKDKHDMSILEQAFEKVEASAPTTPEGKYIVGAHFGIGGYLKDNTLPPADLLAVEKVEEACTNIKDYVDDIRKNANTFIRAVEGAYKGLVVENTHEQNINLFHTLKNSQPKLGSKITQDLAASDPKKDLTAAEGVTSKAPTKATPAKSEQATQKTDDLDAKLDAAEAAAQSESAVQKGDKQPIKAAGKNGQVK